MEANDPAETDSSSEPWSFTPQISGKLITNSTIQIKIANLDEWADKCCPLEPNELESWCLLYRVVPNTDNHIHMDTVYIPHDGWMTQVVLFTCFNTLNEFYVKVPFSLTGYQIQFKMTCMNPKTNESLNTSNPITVTLPPYGIYNDYTVGDYVDFLYLGKFVEAEIVHKLDDNFYKLQFQWFGPQKQNTESQEQQEEEEEPDSDEEVPFTVVSTKCHASKFVASSCEAIKILSGMNPLDRLFCSNVSDDDMITFYTLVDTLYELRDCEVECEPMEYHEMWVTDVPGQVFVAKNVMEHLLGAQPFEYRIECLMNCNDGILEMCNVGQDQVEMVRNGTFTVQQFETLKTSCDFCSCEVTKFDYIWQCQIEDSCKESIERHCYCVWCIDQIIRLKRQMDGILLDALNGQLIEDCITIISDYLIAKIRCTPCAKGQGNINSLKRKICELENSKDEVDALEEEETCSSSSSPKRRKIND